MAKGKSIPTEINDALSSGDQMLERAAGAIQALVFSLLHEFSDAGNNGVVEIHVRGGKPSGVFVRRIEENPPKNVRGQIAGWELTPTQLMEVFMYSRQNVQ